MVRWIFFFWQKNDGTKKIIYYESHVRFVIIVHRFFFFDEEDFENEQVQPSAVDAVCPLSHGRLARTGRGWERHATPAFNVFARTRSHAKADR